MLLFQALIVAACAATFVPQAVRSFRHDPAGVSASAYAVMLATTVAWLAYGVAVGDPLQLAVNIPVGLVLLVIIGRLLRAGAPPRDVAVPAVIAGAAATTAALAGGGAAGAIGATLVAYSVGSQSLTVWRHPDPHGVSVLTWMLLAAQQIMWLVYALITAQPWVAGSATMGTLGALTVTSVTLVRRARLAAEPEPVLTRQ